MSRARLLVVPAVVAVALVGALAGPASAHVTVRSDDAKAGDYAKLTFRVPDESADARTVQLRVDLPADAPFASVSVEPQPGWTWSSTESTLPKPITTDDGDTVTKGISSITWKTTGPGLRPGEFGEFGLSVGPLPARTALSFPATQSYSDGSVVRWNEQTPAGGAEPDHPAPTISLTAAAAPGAAAPTARPASSDSDGTRALAIVGLVLGALGALTGGLALARAGRARRSEGVAA